MVENVWSLIIRMVNLITMSKPGLSRGNFVLAVLSAAEQGEFQPVHVQKLFFLIDKRVSTPGIPYFDFQPYDYGPYDIDVYHELDRLQGIRLVRKIVTGDGWGRRTYSLTHEGQQRGGELFSSLPEGIRKKIKTLVEFVLSLSFTQLVSAIYKRYPEMKENSVFSE